MWLIRFGKWSHAAGIFFTWDRAYTMRGKPSPFCYVKRRYKNFFGYFKKGDE